MCSATEGNEDSWPLDGVQITLVRISEDEGSSLDMKLKKSEAEE